MSIKQINEIDFSKIKGITELQKTLDILIDAVENLAQRNKELEEENRRLKDELTSLKGGNAQPKFKGKKRVGTDISSKGKEKGKCNATTFKEREPRSIVIDKEIKVEMDKKDLPPDAVFKGFVPYCQQDLSICRNNKKFLLSTYYSPSENKTYKAALPEGETSGHFGAGVRSLINVLHHYGNVTSSGLAGLLEGFGIQISPGSISNLLKGERDWSVEEQSAILRAGLAPQGAIQMDCTGNRQRGVNKTTHIITAPLFSVFYTLDSKSRLDCLRALQGKPAGGVTLMWHEDMRSAFRSAKVSKSDSGQVMELLKKYAKAQLSMDEFDVLLQTHTPAIYNKSRIVSVLKETMALYYYDQQEDFKKLKLLMSDDAPEYNKIAENHGLCWVHDARYYNKLSPRLEVTKQRLESFMAAYWGFYGSLLEYKTLSEKQRNRQKPMIIKAFDHLFTPATRYGHLDLCIERTRSNKDQLLRVLDFPDMPLHNNEAELGARKVVRKRDISLHTWTDWGTELRDAFLSIIETARKLNVPVYRYINDRITEQYQLPSLAEIIATRSS